MNMSIPGPENTQGLLECVFNQPTEKDPSIQC